MVVASLILISVLCTTLSLSFAFWAVFQASFLASGIALGIAWIFGVLAAVLSVVMGSIRGNLGLGQVVKATTLLSMLVLVDWAHGSIERTRRALADAQIRSALLRVVDGVDMLTRNGLPTPPDKRSLEIALQVSLAELTRYCKLRYYYDVSTPMHFRIECLFDSLLYRYDSRHADQGVVTTHR